jgi:hypothetical protein
MSHPATVRVGAPAALLAPPAQLAALRTALRPPRPAQAARAAGTFATIRRYGCAVTFLRELVLIRHSVYATSMWEVAKARTSAALVGALVLSLSVGAATGIAVRTAQAAGPLLAMLLGAAVMVGIAQQTIP